MLDDVHIERYSRQIILPQVGGRGQEMLLAASVAVVGAGEIGSAAALYLVAAGVGRLRIVDDAAAQAPGLLPPAAAVAAALASLNPDCRIESCDRAVTSDGADAVAAGHDVIIGAGAKFDVCCGLAAAGLRRGTPLLWGSAAGFVGQCTALGRSRADAPCYRCLHPQPPTLDAGTAFSPAAAFIGTVLATEAIKRLIGIQGAAIRRLVRYNALEGTVDEVAVQSDPHCVLCGVRGPGAPP